MIEHVGFVVEDRARFERFWCGILGYEVAREGHLIPELVSALFGLPGEAKTVRYTLKQDVLLGGHVRPSHYGPDVEIHIFECGPGPASQSFNRGGLNHVSLIVPDKVKWTTKLPDDVKQLWYNNPGGWKNLFVQDYDGNWIEVRD